MASNPIATEAICASAGVATQSVGARGSPRMAGVRPLVALVNVGAIDVAPVAQLGHEAVTTSAGAFISAVGICAFGIVMAGRRRSSGKSTGERAFIHIGAKDAVAPETLLRARAVVAPCGVVARG